MTLIILEGFLSRLILFPSLGMSFLNQREINWRDFHSLLSRGHVERVKVINNKYVQVEMRGGGEGAEQLWFTIGKVFKMWLALEETLYWATTRRSGNFSKFEKRKTRKMWV